MNEKIVYACAVAAMVLACSENSTQVQSDSSDGQGEKVAVMTSAVISDPANDPYSVENMNKALKRTVLAKSKSAEDSAGAESLSFEPNYLYVRFLAKGKLGERALKQYDTSLVLFKHPLDYKPIKKPSKKKERTCQKDCRKTFRNLRGLFSVVRGK